MPLSDMCYQFIPSGVQELSHHNTQETQPCHAQRLRIDSVTHIKNECIRVLVIITAMV